MDNSMIGCWLSERSMDDPARKRKTYPMLRRFNHHTEPIKFEKKLGEGLEGKVYRVRIKGQEYALKIV